MANVTLPTPVFLAGGALCLVAGYLAGAVIAPGTSDRTTGQVVSFEQSTSRLCLKGDAITDQEGVDSDGLLCGTLRRTPRSALPAKGDAFRFVSVRTAEESDGTSRQQVVIYGDVVD